LSSKNEEVNVKKNLSANFISFLPDTNKIDQEGELLVKRDLVSGGAIFVKKVGDNNKTRSQSINSVKIKFDTILATFAFLESIKHILKIKDATKSFEIATIIKDSLGKTHVKLKQLYNGFKIYGTEISAHLNSAGQGELFTGYYVDTTSLFSCVLKLSQKEALDIVLSDLVKQNSIKKLTQEEARLVQYAGPIIDTLLYNRNNNKFYTLIYKIKIRSNFLTEWEYFVDGQTGEIIKSLNKKCSLDGSYAAYSKDLMDKSVKVNSFKQGDKYYLLDVTKPMYLNKTQGVISTFDGNASKISNIEMHEIVSLNGIWTDPKLVSAHNNASNVYDYFKSVHNRNSIDNQGGNIISIVNVRSDDSTELDNAFYNYPVIVYGNGNHFFKPLARALDVAAHEISHGVINFSAQFEYIGQSGALSESFADIFASMVDSTNWTIGEDIVNPNYFPSGALRSLENPHNGGNGPKDYNWQPKHMNEYVNLLTTEKGNWGGVHVNSGIPNHAFFLLANSFVGRIASAKIFYRALTNYLTSYAQFIDLRYAVMQAAEDLYDERYVQMVQDIFDRVGIKDLNVKNETAVFSVNPGIEYLLNYKYENSNQGICKTNASGLNISIVPNKILNKPSVTDNGKMLVYVGLDNRIYSMNPTINSNLSSATVIQPDKFWTSVAISKDGKKLAATSMLDDTAIYVYELNSKIWQKFKLFNPVYSHGINKTNPLAADIMEWDYNGEYLYYDALNIADSMNIRFWDISKIKVWDNDNQTFTEGKEIEKIKQINVLNGENIGNPVLAKNSPFILAFDFFNASDLDKFYILGYDLLKNMTDTIVVNNTLGYPTYNKYDNKIAYVSANNDHYAINILNLSANKISAKNLGQLMIDSAQWPIFFANGFRSIDMPATPVIKALSDTFFCENSSIVLISNNSTGNQWFKDGIISVPDTLQTIIVKQGGSYTVRYIKDGVASLQSNIIHAISIPKPLKPQIPYVETLQFCLHDSSTALVAKALDEHKLIWYDTNNAKGVASNKNIKPSTESSGLYNYFVSQRSLKYGCESQLAKISVKVNALPASPIITPINLCENQISDTLKIEHDKFHKILWYSNDSLRASVSPNPPVPNTKIPNSTNYFVAQKSETTGCISEKIILPVNVTAIPITPTLIKDIAGILISSEKKRNKWYKDGIELPDTSAFLKPVVSGMYAVKSVKNGCYSELSNGYFYIVQRFATISIQNEYVKLAPNPFVDQFKIDFHLNEYDQLDLELTEMVTGAVIATRVHLNSGQLLRFPFIKAGMYMCRLSTPDKTKNYVFNIIKM
jgi:Zn-dependent metalloprotease